MPPAEPRFAIEAILGAHIALSAAIDCQASDPAGLDPTTADLLLRVWLSPGSRCRAAELSEQLMMSPSHISRRLDRAAEAGLVCREPDPDDRRAHQVCLTDAGNDAVGEFLPRLQKVLDRAIGDSLDSAEQATLIALLNRVEDAARKVVE